MTTPFAKAVGVSTNPGQSQIFTENGKQSTTTKLALICKQATSLALKGQTRPLMDLLKVFGSNLADPKREGSDSAFDSADDDEMRQSILRRMKEKTP